MSVYSESELDYLTGGPRSRLARIATVGRDGTPHVVPVGFGHNPEHDSIDIGGRDFARTKKFRDVARTGRAAIVIDDLASTNPWRPRGIEVRGRAEAIAEPQALIRIHPERIVSWGLGAPRSARDVHTAPADAGDVQPGGERGPAGPTGRFQRFSSDIEAKELAA